MSNIINAFAGLGILFAGLNLLTSVMRDIASSKFLRNILVKMTKTQSKSIISGALLGGLTQSTSAATFACIGLLESGAINFSRTLTLISWASVGQSVIVFLVAINIKMISFISLAIVGVMYLFNLHREINSKKIINAFFSFGLILFGLSLIKETSHVLNALPILTDFFTFSRESFLIGFIVGTIAAIIIQSSSTVSIIAITLNIAGIITFNDALILIFGANFGSGLSVLLFTSHLAGRQKQVAIFAFATKLFGIIALLPIFFIDQSKLLSSLQLNYDLSIYVVICIVYAVLQLAGAITISFFQGLIIKLLNLISPISEEDNLSKLRYIYAEASEDTQSAVALTIKEQNKLINELTFYLQPIRNESETHISSVPIKTRHELGVKITASIKEFLSDTIKRGQSDSVTKDLFILQNRNEAIESIIQTVYSFSDTLLLEFAYKKKLGGSLTESLHMILSLLVDHINGDEDNLEMLSELTSERGALMDNIRNSLSVSNAADGTNGKQSLYLATSLFERTLWLIKQINKNNP